jgi:hypothetical protein
MDPNGNFHRLIEEEDEPALRELLKKTKAKEYTGQHPLHPDHRRMVLEVNRRPVPKDWPIFKVGEVYTVGDTKLEVVSISRKDLHMKTVDGEPLERGDNCMLQKRMFRVRFTRWCKGQPPLTVLRPVVGNTVRS